MWWLTPCPGRRSSLQRRIGGGCGGRRGREDGGSGYSNGRIAECGADGGNDGRRRWSAGGSGGGSNGDDGKLGAADAGRGSSGEGRGDTRPAVVTAPHLTRAAKRRLEATQSAAAGKSASNDDGQAQEVAAKTAVNPPRAKPKDDGRAQEVAAKTAVNPPRAKPKDDGRAQEVAAKTAVNPPRADLKDDGRAQEVAAKTAVNPPRAKPIDDGRAPEVAAKTAVNPERADLKDDGRARKVAAETAVKPARVKTRGDERVSAVAAKGAEQSGEVEPGAERRGAGEGAVTGSSQKKRLVRRKVRFDVPVAAGPKATKWSGGLRARRDARAKWPAATVAKPVVSRVLAKSGERGERGNEAEPAEVTARRKGARAVERGEIGGRRSTTTPYAHEQQSESGAAVGEVNERVYPIQGPSGEQTVSEWETT
ncbi:hypothetical protein GN244_ATG18989 [Phytophthora infestans]|uniref:Uncharacterized protein n=1 Tax=Phytophthora infestans TaxID=4787 RepID=A0A833S7T3_PHYIN|nr:hypothetical protein GN244_ATG18989 [Phytophthora infestans]